MNRPNHSAEQQPAGTIALHHAWPQLARALYTLEQEALDAANTLDEDHKHERRQRIREIIVEQCEQYERQYEAYELVRSGRAAELVGNPHYRGKDGQEHELPYTGLEGYYAGSEAQPQRAGLTREQIIEEEATIGSELLKKLKQSAIEHDCWAEFARLQKAAAGDTEEVDREVLKHLYFLWTTVVRRLQDRIYANADYQVSPLEQLETILRKDPKLAADEHLQAEYRKLLEEEHKKSHEQRAKEAEERRAKESRFRSRLEEYAAFRSQTYAALKDACGRFPHIDYHIEDDSLAHATILETLHLPRLAERSSYPPYLVALTAQQLEGYLFLAQVGEKGGDPLARSELLVD
jgi:hypothetical protein